MNNENQNIEYKESWRDEYVKWLCGFANAQGGVMYIGIDDDGQVLGLNNIHKWQEDIPNKIVQNLGIVWRFMVRNNAFSRAGFIDTWGRGFQKIRDGFEADGIPMPRIENFCGGVRVTIKRTVFMKLSHVGSYVGSDVTSLSPVKLTENIRDYSSVCRRACRRGCRRGWRRDSFSTLYCQTN